MGDTAPRRSSPGLDRALLALLLAYAAVVRWLAADSQLWLDEVWSWRLALEEAHGFSDLLLHPRLRWDNNHLLNTAFIRLVGPVGDPRIYRLLALASGVGAVAAAAWITARERRVTRWVTLLAMAAAYPLVVYGSEARGYAPLVLFALLAFGLQRSELKQQRTWRWALLQLCVVAGFLSHLTFAFVYVGLGCWAAWRLFATGPRRAALIRLIRLHGLTGLLAVVLYLVFARHVVSLPGPHYPLGQVLRETAGFALGGPLAGPPSWIVLGLVAAAVGLELWREARAREDSWVFHLTALVLAPALLLLLLRPPVIYSRYFVATLPFLFLLLGRLVARAAAWRRAAGLALGALLTLGLTGHLARSRQLVHLGRGGYREALATMARQTRSSEIHVGSTADPCVDPLRFYSPGLPPGRRIRYHAGGLWVAGWRRQLALPRPGRSPAPGGRASFVMDGWPPSGAEWLVVLSSGPHPRDRVTLDRRQHRVRYRLEAVFPAPPLTGQSWYLYRKP